MKGRLGSRWMRSRDTCTQCRIRKVRCDGQPGTCGNCERLKFECSFSRGADGRSSMGLVVAQPERRRITQACTDCRVQKIRCTGERPRCSNCQRRGRQCTYPTTGRPLRSVIVVDQPDGDSVQEQSSPENPDQTFSPQQDRSPASQPRAADSSAASDGTNDSLFTWPSKDDMLQMIKDYFQFICPLPTHSFMHETSTIQLCAEDALEDCLALAICATTALHLRIEKFFPDTTSLWIQRAETIIWQRLESPSVFWLQALLLVVRYQIETGNFQRAFMLSSLTSRAAGALRLNYERRDLSFLARENRRRLMWAIRVLDGAFSVGLPELELFSSENIYIHLPCQEEVYQASNPVDLEARSPLALTEPAELGLLATCIRLYLVRRDTVRLSRQLALTQHPMSQLDSLVRNFQQELQQIQLSLLGPTSYSSANMARFLGSRRISRYLLAHLSWHHSHYNLYRIFLSGFPEAASEAVLRDVDPAYIAAAERTCIYHSLTVVDILSEFDRQLEKHCFVEFDTAICAYHAVRLLLFCAAKNDSSLNLTMTAAIQKSEICFRIVTRLFPHSAMADAVKQDIRRLISEYSSGKTDLSTRFPSLYDDAYPEDPTHLYQATRSHQKLAVHSVLHQADFVDDTYDVRRPMAISNLIHRPNPEASSPDAHNEFPPMWSNKRRA